MNNNYRFKFRPYRTGSKRQCPQCGKKGCLTTYIDVEGQYEFPDYVGRCDHENSCGYIYTPWDYLRDNPTMRKDSQPSYSPAHVVLPMKPGMPSFIPVESMRQTLGNYDLNPLYKFLSGLIGETATGNLFRLYNVGTAKRFGGSTIFWQMDKAGRVRTGKVMAYDPQTGHRIKDAVARITWIHSLMKLPDFNLRQCFFGEHLLSQDPDKSVAIVESEKSALIAAHFMPEFIWLASGGCNGCLKNSADALAGRNVMLVPDLGMMEKWRSMATVLKSACRSVIVTDRLERIATQEQQEQGLDVADFLIEYALQPEQKPRERPIEEWTDQEILDLWISENPSLKRLIEDFDMSLVPSG